MDATTIDVGLKIAALILTLANLLWGVKTWLTHQENQQRKEDRERLKSLEMNKADIAYVAAVEKRSAHALKSLREDINSRLDMLISLIQVRQS